MATTYKTPGVYVEEISVFPPSVSQVETAIPAFIGYTEKAKKVEDDDLLKVPTRITSLLEYAQYFGGADKEENLVVNINDDYSSGSLVRTIEAPAPTTKSPYLMYYSLQMYFANGGGPCYIISVGDYSSGTVSKSDLGSASGGLAELAKEDEPTLILFPDATNVNNVTNFYDLYEEALTQCNKLQDRFTIIDTYNQSSTFAETLRTQISLGTDFLKYGAAYYPWLKTTLPYAYDEADVSISHTEVDPPGGTTNYDGLAVNDATLVADTALYNKIKNELGKLRVTLPPSGAVAGVYARVDSTRGVWKAPANVGVMNIVGPDKKVTNEEQDGLNDHPTGKSINVIRTFTGKGTLVWGARTLAGNDNEWRYISVRRFFNMVEESVKKATGQFVFEPNDANTWIKVRAMIENFLILQWRAGALAGAKPEEAFFVKVGLGQTMTAQDILEGKMIVEIGMAAVRPAEFIILRFSHKMQES